MNFDSRFWHEQLQSLGYVLHPEDLDAAALKEQGSIGKDFMGAKITRLYRDNFTEITVIFGESGASLSRALCTRTARLWKQHRLIRPLLLFTDGNESYAVMVPGKGTGGEARILVLSDSLYRTDREVLQSMQYPGTPEELSKAYDTIFFPYEKVRDEFFTGYRGLYQEIETTVKKHLPRDSSSYAQRFLGRLMFIYFLQRKGWLKSDKRFVDKIGDYRELNLLFYESLNREGSPGIPFLNGSLFEREDYMNTNLENSLFKDMNTLFNRAREFFNSYNFTVDESSSLEVEVSIDPALIGTVFENMLPEHERGTKGVFYTPVPEASFICRRALSHYLGFKDEMSQDKKTFLDGLSIHLAELRESKSEHDIREFRERLLSLRILDPAVGSGGFLVVMMQTIVEIIQEAEAIAGWITDAEEYKKRILPNLYGFDIEPEAIEIARLRLWLSLIIAQREPEPLPNLDMNLVTIKDSLRMPNSQSTLDFELEELKERFFDLKNRYLSEHISGNKRKLREQLEKLENAIVERSGTSQGVIEVYMPKMADVIIMNPPYVNQLAIKEESKHYYSTRYGLDKTSDLYAYFLLRALQLLSDSGVASVISSDKWLETEYGVKLQEKLRNNLIGIYGQWERSFGADINTVITVFTRKKQIQPIDFTYLESYSKDAVKQESRVERNTIPSGKWFYLRAPKVFMESVLPKLNHKLSEYAEIQRGFTTGANEFFYIEDVGHQFETDALSESDLPERSKVYAKTKQDLDKQGLVYVQNEFGKRFLIDKKDLAPVIRSPTELESYSLGKPKSLVFKPIPPRRPGEHSKRYIDWAENYQMTVTRGKHKDKTVRGIDKLATVRAHRPHWFNVADLPPAELFHPIGTDRRHFVLRASVPSLSDQMLVMIRPKTKALTRNIWIYLNSIVAYLTFELYGRRFGGGALQVPTGVMESLPVPDMNNMQYRPETEVVLAGKIQEVSVVVESKEREDLDVATLLSMGIRDAQQLLPQLRQAFTELVQDRLVKGSRSPSERTDDEDDPHDQDN